MPFYILYLFASDSSFKFVFADVCRLLYILCRGGKEDVFAVATFLFSRFFFWEGPYSKHDSTPSILGTLSAMRLIIWNRSVPPKKKRSETKIISLRATLWCRQILMRYLYRVVSWPSLRPEETKQRQQQPKLEPWPLSRRTGWWEEQQRWRKWWHLRLELRSRNIPLLGIGLLLVVDPSSSPWFCCWTVPNVNTAVHCRLHV